MKIIKIPFLLIWRSWFYIMIFITIVIMSPVLFILTLKEEYYPTLWKVVRFWSKILIYGMGFRLNFKLDQEIEPNKSYMFCPNHGSLMDGFVLVASSKNPIVFVGKKELEKIPIFGFFYKRVVIMVDNEDYIDLLCPFSAFLRCLIDYVEHLSLGQVRKIFYVLC